MPLTISRYLATDHDRLDGLLSRAAAVPGQFDQVAYDAFRGGLLRHIAMEERTLFPAILRFDRKKEPVVRRLRLDHGALSALLVPPPDPVIIATLRLILSVHNPLEEGEEGVYRYLERLAGPEGEELLEELEATPDVPVAPYNRKPGVLEATRRAVSRAGYEFRHPPL